MKYLYMVSDERELERLRESTKKMLPLLEKLPGSGMPLCRPIAAMWMRFLKPITAGTKKGQKRAWKHGLPELLDRHQKNQPPQICGG